MYKHLWTITLGDWSGDGHEKVDVTIINSDITLPEFEDLLQKGEQLLGFKFSEECSEYEENKLSDYAMEAVKTHLGYTPPSTLLYDDFIHLLIRTAKVVRPELKIEIVELPTLADLGYGLFCE